MVNCKASGFGWLGAPVALISQGDCVRKFRQQGFYGFDEAPGSKPMRASDVHYKSAVGLTLPEGWNAQSLTESHKNKGIRLIAINPTIDAGVMVSTIKRSGISDFRTYAETKRSASLGVGTQPVVGDLSFSEESGRTVARYGVTTTLEGNRIRYAYTVIQGETEIAILAVWATAGNFDAIRPQLEQVTSGLSGI